MKNQSIRRRFTVIVLAVTVAIAGFFHFVWLPRVAVVLTEAKTRDVHRQVEILVDGLLPFLLSGQYAAAYETLDHVKDRHPDWLELSLYRPDGRRIYPLSTPEAVDGPNLVRARHVIGFRGDTFGTLDVTVDLAEEIRILHREEARMAILAFAFLMSAMFLMGYLLDRLVTRRLSVLATAADEMSAGNFSARLPEASSDEVGRLAQSFSDMRSQIFENTVSLKVARTEAEAALEAKSRFLATMSHEIRTPLNGVIPVAELLLDGDLSQSQRNQVETIQKSGKALLSIVDDILDLSKLEAGMITLRKERFGLDGLVGNVLDILQAPAETKNLYLNSEIADDVRGNYDGDEDRLRQVLINLVGNAIKFTERGGVTVRVCAAPDADGILRFEVIDTGIGIPTSEHGRIFERFEQVDDGRTRRFGGSGLGLSITKALVSAFGGEIGVESAPERGSKFWFTLPLERVEADVPETKVEEVIVQERVPTPRAPVAASPEMRKVLVADDNFVNRTVATAILQDLGFEVTAVESGKDAVSAAGEHSFDLVLMDMHMPEMDGLEATRRIRESEGPNTGTRIIALTASVLQEDVDSCFEAGMNDFLSKPLVKAKVQELLVETSA
ncbi:MAG: response regulator [Rhodobacteraceae bacterium]|nr:response regulator [Paracoccaceae bacterium]